MLRSSLEWPIHVGWDLGPACAPASLLHNGSFSTRLPSRALPKSAGESATRALGGTGRNRGETKPFDFKTNAERLSSERSQAPALPARLV